MSSTIGERDIVVQFQSDTLQQIRDDHPLYISLQYLLLFPYGEYGFHPDIPLHLKTGTSRTRKFLTLRQFYAAQIQTRLNQGMTLIKGGRLFHQYVVDVYTTIEEDRLRWARNNQDVLRAELYSNVLDAVGKGDTDAKIIGQRVYGNPDLFITMTANPNWREIREHLEKYGGDSPNDRPDIECRVFKMKLDQLLKDFKNRTFFRPYTAALHRIEFQKRGLPHAHILLWLGNSSRTPSAQEIDEIISAELPNKEEDPEAYNLVIKHMIHGPCGDHVWRRMCAPKSILDRIMTILRLISQGIASAVIEKGYTATTSDAVVSSEPKDKVIKQRNEIQEFIDVRYLSACEDMWRTFAFHIHKRKPSVEKLIIHLEALSRVTSRAGLKIIKGEDSHPRIVKNIVYKEIFNSLRSHESK
ncbi:unnamed protein product [Brassica rapa subsp. narinosa]